MKKTKCRICPGALRSVLNLGAIKPSNFVDNGYEIKPEPLHLVSCERCGLVQLEDTIDLDSMYHQYWYRSGLNPRMVEYLKEVVSGIEQRVRLNDGDHVLDIGANDGTLLTLYKNKNITTVGVDPAKNLAIYAEKNCDFFFNDYFRPGLLPPYLFKAITTIAMFYDLDDPISFISTVTSHLHPDGVWVIQFTDLVSMLKLNEFGHICHEHIIFYTLRDLVDLLFRFNLDVFDVEYSTVNGGSLRAYVCHKDKYRIHDRVVFALRDEKNYLKEDDIHDFSQRILQLKYGLVNLLKKLKRQGKTIHILGGSTKGNTVLQFFGIDSELIDCVAEINPDKYGRRTVGSDILIISEEDSLKIRPDYYLVLPWHFKDFFIEKLQSYIKQGGKLIFPMPELHIYPYE